MALVHRFPLQSKVYLAIIGFSAILPTDHIVLALGGLIVVLIVVLMILKGHRKKKSGKKLKKRVSKIKSHFNHIKDQSVDHQEDDWLEMRLKEDSDE